ncbi:uncharacterized protein B0I36DRAFT_138410 [Microdochium trichocladiopsis]|uniref:Uncharacterized protein n=1 Tax=Microdochium trichocladiopsis TaxID=1682393 RepID=A0A9P9BN80_9PEZI|nr:uncharacterized protein B0I36DRAFT_138410 [Microdochium trichocladiopsis]KAH7027431.1 hypothetical protein B0I36DRAFT_138410 [Microdochium trichocladiopsis]
MDDDDPDNRPPAYGEALYDAVPGAAAAAVAAAAATTVEPLSLVINGQSIYRDNDMIDIDNNSNNNNNTAPTTGTPAPPGLALYAMNRGIASLSHTDSSVTFERLDHAVRHTSSSNRMTSRSKHIFTLRHIDDLAASFHARPLRGYRNRPEGAGESAANIPRFFCQAESRRSLGSFGLRKCRYRPASAPTAAAAAASVSTAGADGAAPSYENPSNHNHHGHHHGAGPSSVSPSSRVGGLAAKLIAAAGSEHGYAVVPLARRRAEHDIPRFAAGEKGHGYARPIFEVRRRAVAAIALSRQQQQGDDVPSVQDGLRHGEGGGGRGGGRRLSGLVKGKGKATTTNATTTSASATTTTADSGGSSSSDTDGVEWEWFDEFGTLVAREDQVWRSPLPPPPPPPASQEGLPLPVSPPAAAVPTATLHLQQQQQQPPPPRRHHHHRLVTLQPLPRETFDVLVSSWCLRVWWANADSLPGADDMGGMSFVRRKFKAAQDFGVGTGRDGKWGITP